MFLTKIVCFYALIVASLAHEAANVLHYDTSAFAANIGTGPHFVMFYAPWCGHCKRLIPTWDELGKLHNQDRARQDITIAKVDCTVDTALCSEQGVTGYPTLKLFSGSANPIKYKGTRDLAPLIRFIENQLAQQHGGESAGSLRPVPVDGMVEWTEELFTKHIGQGHHFIKFFAPWCGHCKTLAPTWERLAKHHGNDLSLTIGRVDCTVEQNLCQQQNVRGYPTLLWFTNGNKVGQYDGEREISALTAYVHKMQLGGDSAAAAEVVPENFDTNTNNANENHHWPKIVDGVVQLTTATFDDHTSGAAMFIKFYAPWCGHCKQLAPTWTDLAKTFADDGLVIIAKVDCQQEGGLCSVHGIQGYPTLGWFVDGKLVDKYEGLRDLESLKAFVDLKKSELPKERVHSLTSSSFANVIAKGDHFVQFYTPYCRECKETQQIWADVAKRFARDPELTVSKVDCTLHQSVCSNQRIIKYPTMVFYRDGKQIGVYEFQLVLSHFVRYAKEQIKTRGQTIPAEAEASDTQQQHAKHSHTEQQHDTAGVEVLSLTMDTFAHMTATGSTFVKFYAPWCGHCKKLAPTWQELAKRFAGSSSVRIVKVDCTVEKKLCQDHQVQGYPSLKLYREGVFLKKYDGARDLESLVQFVTSNAPVDRDEL